MRKQFAVAASTLIVLAGLSLYSVVHAQNAGMARHEPQMSAALGHLEQAKQSWRKPHPTKADIVSGLYS
jgi:hypothetical protein